MKQPLIGIVHTSFALVEPLNTLINEQIPGVGIINIVDDTLLDYARSRGVDERLTRRMCKCFSVAIEANADIVLNACSSVGETVDVARKLFETPIIKIDEPMADAAVKLGGRISVLATVPSTLDPTCRLLKAKAIEHDTEIEITPVLCDGAFDLLVSGKADEHDALVKRTVQQVIPKSDVIVLAQASMERLVPQIEGDSAIPILSSPSRVIAVLKEKLSQV